MIFTNEVLIIFIAVLIVCLIGFKKYIWFISLGYGFSISIIGIMLLILFRNNLNFSFILASIVFILYGLRRSGFLAYREIKNSSYNRKMKSHRSAYPYLKVRLRRSSFHVRNRDAQYPSCIPFPPAPRVQQLPLRFRRTLCVRPQSKRNRICYFPP